MLHASARRRLDGATLLIILVAMVTLAGCSSKRHYVRIAEGLTAPTLAEGIRVAPRMFSAFELVQACRDPVRIDRLETTSSRLALQIGERFPLAALSVVAVNEADIAVPGVAIAIEAEDSRQMVLQLRSDDRDLDQGRIHAINSGSFRVRIRTLCGTPGAEARITGRAVP